MWELWIFYTVKNTLSTPPLPYTPKKKHKLSLAPHRSQFPVFSSIRRPSDRSTTTLGIQRRQNESHSNCSGRTGVRWVGQRPTTAATDGTATDRPTDRQTTFCPPSVQPVGLLALQGDSAPGLPSSSYLPYVMPQNEHPVSVAFFSR